MRRSVRYFLLCAVAAALLVVNVGSASSHGARRAPHAAALATLNVETDSTIVNYGPFWYALATNEFQKNGLNVNLVTTNGSLIGLSLLASGKADVLLGNIGDVYHAVTAGQPISAVFGLDRFGLAQGAIVSRPGIKTLAQLKSMGTNCKLGEAGPGTGLYAYAVDFERAFGVKCQLDNVAGYPAEVAEATAGELDAAALNAQNTYTLQSEGKANILVNPASMSVANQKKMFPVNYPFLNIIGATKDILSPAKHTAMLDFLRTLEAASVQIQTISSSNLAQLLIQKLSADFGTTTQAALTESITLNRPLFAMASPGLAGKQGQSAGYITSTGWNYMLSILPSDWITGGNSKLPGIQYHTAVNMSLLSEVAPTVNATNTRCGLSSQQVSAGTDTFTLTNNASGRRRFSVNGAKTKYIAHGKSASVITTLRPGTVTYRCIAPGDKKVGGGSLSVKSA